MEQVSSQEHDELGRQNGAENRLFYSAVKIFSSKGYEATSIREIIEDAGVSRPVLYYYFKNKEELYCRLIERPLEELADQMKDLMGDEYSSRERLCTLLQYAFLGATTEPDIARLLLQFFFSPPLQHMRLDREDLSNQFLSFVREIMNKGIEKGELKGGDPQNLAISFCGIMDMYVVAMLHGIDVELTPELANSLVEIFMNGAQAEGLQKQPSEQS